MHIGQVPEVQLNVVVQQGRDDDQTNLGRTRSMTEESITPAQTRRNYKRWIRVFIYTVFLPSGQAVAMLLGLLYFVKGGNSKWLATLVQLVGFPILIPFYLISTIKINQNPTIKLTQTKPPSAKILTSIYVSIRLLVAGDCYLYSIGLQYHPVSTYTLICASQLAFNSLFSFFFNAQKFTPFIINSLVLLTISSVLLVFNNESSNSASVSQVKYEIGFICTVAASEGYGLVLSLTQLCFNKVIKKQTFKVIVDMIIYQQVVATCVIVVGLFGSGEWNGLTREMDEYKMGKHSYAMNLVGTSIAWQVFAIGSVGLIFEVSSLFSNAISVVGLPIVPVLAVFVFHDKMDGVKAISMVLAICGFISYIYQHYLDDSNCNVSQNRNDVNPASRAPILQES